MLRPAYEQITGGRLREVRLNVTLPTGESNLAVVGLMSTSVTCWTGLPQPAGGFPLPSDSGSVARQNDPSISAHSMPQCVYGRCDRPECGCATGSVVESIVTRNPQP